MMKKLKMTALFCCLAALLAMAGCGKKNTSSEWDLPTLTDRLLNEITYTDTLTEMDSDLMSYLFSDIDPADIEEKIIYLSTGSTAEEIAAFKAIDTDAAERIEAGLLLRVENQTESFTDYVPEEVKRLNDAVLIRNGVYVVLSVSAEPDTAKSILK